jgi:ATP-binding cassette, subfamily B, bacterial
MTIWWARIGRYAWPHRRSAAVVLGLTFVIVALDTLKPWPMKVLIDDVLPGQPLPDAVPWLRSLPGAGGRVGMLAWLTVSTVLLFVAAGLGRVVRSYVQTGMSTRMSYDLATDLFVHLQRLSLRFHRRHARGDLVQRVMDETTCVRDLTVSVALPLLASMVSLLTMFALMWSLDRMVTLAALLSAVAMVGMIRVFAPPMTDRRYEQSVREGRMMGLAEQTLAALPVVQAFGREPHEDERFQRVNEQAGRAYLRTLAAELRFQVGVNAVTAIGTAVVIGIGGAHALGGTLSVGELLVLLSYLASLYAPLESLASLSSGFANAAARARRVLEILDIVPEIADAPDARPLPPVRSAGGAHLRFEAVSFAYEPGAAPALQEVSLEVRPGELVALMGATGAGKSTVAALVMRLYDPDHGRVLLDGIDLRTITIAGLRSRVSMVLQDPLLLPVSIAENIAYGCPEATRARIVEAATVANAHRFIGDLSRGYDTIVGERGATLSGGERQRIAIARAVLGDTPLLILDEPTSAVDVQTEAEILQALERLTAGRTTILIAHRLSAVRRADRIIVLDRGRIVETGRHEDLMSRPGPYRRFHEAQRVAVLADQE